MRFVISLGFAILLSSCATTMNNYYTPTVKGWQGGSAANLVKAWGMPDTKATGANGDTIYIYKSESYHAYDTPSSPNIGVNVSSSGRPIIITQPNTNFTANRGMSITCTAIFTTNSKGIITETNILGRGCYGNADFAKRLGNPAAR